jgi:hypothetical protein
MNILTSLRKAYYATRPFDSIVKWNRSRNLTMYDATNEDAMIAEELEELSLARSNHNVNEMVDAYCDLIVLATGAIHKLGFDPTESMAETLLEINSRKGSVDRLTGKWQKDKDQDPSTLYKANYDNAKY